MICRCLIATNVLLLCACLRFSYAQNQDSAIYIPATDHVSTVQFSRDGSYFLALDRDTLRVFAVPSGKPIGVPIGLTAGGYAAFLPGDTSVLTLAYLSDTLFNVWNWRTGSRMRSVNIYRSVSDASLSADGRYIAIHVRFPKEQYELWNVASGTYNGVLLEGADYYGMVLDSNGEFGVLRRYVSDLLYRINTKTHALDSLHVAQGDLFRPYISPDVSRIGYSRLKGKPLVFDARTLDSLFRLDVDMSDRARVTMGFSPDNRWIVTTTTRRTNGPILDLWDGVSGRHIKELGRDTTIGYTAIAVSPKNDFAAIYSLAYGGIVGWPIELPNSSATPVTGVDGRAMMLYPNPTRDGLSVKWQQHRLSPSRVEVWTTRGELVWASAWQIREIGIDYEWVPTTNLPSGTYFCVVQNEERGAILPFAVER